MGLNPDLKNEEGLDMQLWKQGFQVTASSMYEVMDGAEEPWQGEGCVFYVHGGR